VTFPKAAFLHSLDFELPELIPVCAAVTTPSGTKSCLVSVRTAAMAMIVIVVVVQLLAILALEDIRCWYCCTRFNDPSVAVI
jgi:hypothetical protein